MAMDSNKGRGGGATRLVYDEEKLKARARRFNAPPGGSDTGQITQDVAHLQLAPGSDEPTLTNIVASGSSAPPGGHRVIDLSGVKRHKPMGNEGLTVKKARMTDTTSAGGGQQASSASHRSGMMEKTGQARGFAGTSSSTHRTSQGSSHQAGSGTEQNGMGSQKRATWLEHRATQREDSAMDVDGGEADWAPLPKRASRPERGKMERRLRTTSVEMTD